MTVTRLTIVRARWQPPILAAFLSYVRARVAFFISMDYYERVTMRFTWDEKKNLSNIQKHKISFIQAVYVFFDPLRKEYYDEKHSSNDEERFIAIGLAENRLLFVIFTEPEPETIHIISARKTNRHERRYYGNS